MRKGIVVVAMISLVMACLGAPAPGQAEPADKKINVFVSILPVAYFVERVGGPLTHVNVLVGPGQDPHTFEPTPKLMAKLADSRALFKLGFPFEETIIKKLGATLKSLQVVDLQKGIKLRAVTEEEKDAEEAGHGHDQGHGHERGEAAEGHADEMDPHTWLNPQMAKIQARTIAETLSALDPPHAVDYERNLKALETELDAVHDQLTKALAPLKGKSFFVFHPAYGYFGDAYGLKQVPVQIGGKEPTARQLARLIDLAKEDGVKVIFVQPQFSKKSAEALARAIGGVVTPMDDLAPDYLNNLKDMAAKLESALKSERK